MFALFMAAMQILLELHSVRTFLTAKITVFSGSLHFFAV